jgi:hypothetical protein
VRIFVGGPNNLEFVHPQDVTAYLTRLHEAKLSSEFKLHIQIWARHDTYRFGCICPPVTSCPIRVQNKAVAAGLASQLKHLKAFRESFEAERGAKLRMRVTFSMMGDKQTEALAFEIPEKFYSSSCVDGEAWVKMIRGQLYEMTKRRMQGQGQRPRRDSGVRI